MQDFPETRHSLLLRVQRADGDAWAEFSKIYRPMIYRLIRRRGWQDADAQDMAQTVLVKVCKAIATFEPNAERAKFRTWLTTVCKHSMIDELRRRKRESSDDENDGALAEMLEVPDDEISLEHRRQVFRWAATSAADTFAKKTWLAFWRTTVEENTVVETAEELSISVGAVYTARSRVMQFLKKKVQEYDDAEM